MQQTHDLRLRMLRRYGHKILLGRIRLVAAVAATLALSPALAGKLGTEEAQAAVAALADFELAHEGRPQGVPPAYDWYARPVMKHGNDPAGNKAMTGWGHAFWDKYSSRSEATLQLRNLRVFLCAGSPGSWRLVQFGKIIGREFDANFQHNISRPAAGRHDTGGEYDVAFGRGNAFHFWPAAGRHELPDEPICGVVVTVQARQHPPPGTDATLSGQMLLGLGADYWRDRSAVWDGKGSNPGIALGRLRYVTDEWRWYVLNTADKVHTKRLITDGYLDRAR